MPYISILLPAFQCNTKSNSKIVSAYSAATLPRYIGPAPRGYTAIYAQLGGHH